MGRWDVLIDGLRDRRVVALLVGSAAIATTLAFAGWTTPAPLAVAWLTLVPLVVAARAVAPEDRRAIILVSAGGIALRLVLAAVVTFALRSEVFAIFDDSAKYAEIGGALAAAWRSGNSIDLLKTYTLAEAGFYYVVAALDYISGGGPYLVAALNAALAALTATLVYVIATQLGSGPRARLLAAAMATFIPSVVFWSVIPLKDTLVSFLLLLGILAALRVHVVGARYRVPWLVTLALSIGAMTTLRTYATVYIAFFAVAAIAFSGTWRKQMAWSALVLVTIVVAQGWAVLSPAGMRIAQVAGDVGEFDRIHLLLSQGGSGQGGTPAPGSVYATATPAGAVPSASARTPTPSPTAPPPTGSPLPTVTSIPTPSPTTAPPTGSPLPTGTSIPEHISPYLGLLERMPVNTLLFLALPIPFVTRGNLVGLATPEMLAWYALIPFGLFGFWLMWRRGRALTLALAILVLAMAAVYGSIVGNAGTLLRYRAQEMILLTIPISIGIVATWGRWTRHRDER